MDILSLCNQLSPTANWLLSGIVAQTNFARLQRTAPAAPPNPPAQWHSD